MKSINDYAMTQPIVHFSAELASFFQAHKLGSCLMLGIPVLAFCIGRLGCRAVAKLCELVGLVKKVDDFSRSRIGGFESEKSEPSLTDVGISTNIVNADASQHTTRTALETIKGSDVDSAASRAHGQEILTVNVKPLEVYVAEALDTFGKTFGTTPVRIDVSHLSQDKVVLFKKTLRSAFQRNPPAPDIHIEQEHGDRQSPDIRTFINISPSKDFDKNAAFKEWASKRFQELAPTLMSKIDSFEKSKDILLHIRDEDPRIVPELSALIKKRVVEKYPQAIVSCDSSWVGSLGAPYFS